MGKLEPTTEFQKYIEKVFYKDNDRINTEFLTITTIIAILALAIQITRKILERSNNEN